MSNNILLGEILLIAVFVCTPAQCARILGVFPFASQSHYILGNALMRGLAEAGHDVTMISPHEEKNPPTNGSYRDVVLTGFVEDFNKLLKDINLFENNPQSIIANIFMFPMIVSIMDRTLNHTNVQALLNSEEKFDVIILENFVNDALKIFAYHFEAPLILFNSLGPNIMINKAVGNPSPPSYIPHYSLHYSPKMTFFQRIHNVLFFAIDSLLDVFFLPQHSKLVKKYFPDSPDFHDVYHNVSLVLLNSHESTNKAVPLVPSMIQIGGYHVKPPKKLPVDLQDYLDNAKDGVVYFSLGSNLKGKDLPPERRNLFLRVFSKLKQKVLWKWEEDVLPGQPSNVKLGKWFPQQDILAHPNVKVFITHGGLLSSIETVYHGVPILAIPVFADQHENAATAVTNGYALSLAYHDPEFSEEKLSYLLKELLYNPKYRDNVKQRSKLFHDRPQKPMDAAIYWVEYIVRNRGGSHLRVAGVGMPWYKYHLVDVIAFLAGVTISIVVLSCLGIRHLLCRSASTKKEKVKKN